MGHLPGATTGTFEMLPVRITTTNGTLTLSTDVQPWSRAVALVPLLLAVLSTIGWFRGDMKVNGDPAGPGTALLLIGGFSVVAIGFFFGQTKLIVDRTNKVASRWIGALFAIWKRSRRWSEITEVAVKPVARSSNGHSYKKYVVALMTPTGDVCSAAYSCPSECHRAARQVALHMNLPLHDLVKETLVPVEDL